jgi:hypothetical protein
MRGGCAPGALVIDFTQHVPYTTRKNKHQSSGLLRPRWPGRNDIGIQNLRERTKKNERMEGAASTHLFLLRAGRQTQQTTQARTSAKEGAKYQSARGLVVTTNTRKM